MKQILFIVGSRREGSYNRQLAAEAEKLVEGRAEVRYLDFRDMPQMDQNIEYPAPEAVTRVRKAVAEADALWVFSPEYNASYPGVVKILFDWLSRPLVPNDHSVPTVIAGKKITLSGVGGNAAAARCRAKLGDLLTFIRADVMAEPQTGIALDAEGWITGKLVLTEGQRDALRAQTDAFFKFIA